MGFKTQIFDALTKLAMSGEADVIFIINRPTEVEAASAVALEDVDGKATEIGSATFNNGGPNGDPGAIQWVESIMRTRQEKLFILYEFFPDGTSKSTGLRDHQHIVDMMRDLNITPLEVI